MKENVGVAPGITLVDYSPVGAAPDRPHSTRRCRAFPEWSRRRASRYPPLTGHSGVEFRLDGAPETAQPSFAPYEMVTPDYFETMGTRLVRGRDFTAGDQANSPWGVVVNEAFARHLLAGRGGHRQTPDVQVLQQ